MSAGRRDVHVSQIQLRNIVNLILQVIDFNSDLRLYSEIYSRKIQ